MNPYKNLDIYGTKVINKYRGENLSSGSKLQPHLYLVAGQAYQNIRTNMKNQSIIICGESGAGKTVSTKLILQYISIVGGKAGVGDMEKQILSTNPLMEAPDFVFHFRNLALMESPNYISQIDGIMEFREK